MNAVENIRAGLAECKSKKPATKEHFLAMAHLEDLCTDAAMAEVLAHIDAQAAEIARLQADAARYQWLRRNAVALSLPHDTVAMLVLDQSELDAAMKEQQQ